jgi:hypothetical protein
MLDQESGGEASSCGVPGQFLADTRASNLKRRTATTTNSCFDKIFQHCQTQMI